MKKHLLDLCKYNVWATEKLSSFLRLSEAQFSENPNFETQNA